MISKQILLDSLSMLKTEFDNRYASPNYETITEDEVNDLFVEIGTFTYEYLGTTGSSQFEIGMTWQDYIVSKYNTINCSEFGVTGVAIDTCHIVGQSATEINPPVLTDTIINGYNYYAVIEFE